jgi:enoyl-CoA hydratase/carnithine racemase
VGLTPEDHAKPVLADRDGPVMVLTLNRPDRLNAWNDQMEDRYFELLDDCEADPGIAAIVVTGSGRAFCSGADLGDLAQADGDESTQLPVRPRPRSYPLQIRKPIIAAINGAAAGLGLVEALYCDLRFCTPQAKLTTAFTRRGLIAEYGSAWILQRLVGVSRSLDLLLSGRVVLGEEALQMGLVDRLVAPDRVVEEAVRYASELATLCSPTAMAVVKQQVYDAASSDFAGAVAAADQRMLESFRRIDVTEGVASYLERRQPQFPGLPTQRAAES